MTEILLKILPSLLIFALGFVLKQLKVFSKKDAEVLLRIVFYLALPALILNTVLKIELKADLFFFPLIAAVVIFLMYIISYPVSRLLKLERPSLGVFIISTMLLNIGFLLSFIMAAYGNEGIARIAVFDVVNGLLAFTFVYYQACKSGTKGSSKGLYKKFLFSAPLWALVIALAINILDFTIPLPADRLIESLGLLAIPLVMLSLGLYFEPRINKPIPMLSAIIIRMGIGISAGWLLSLVFGLEGLDRSIVILGSAAPAGYNTLVFSTMEELDTEFAASIVSYSILAGIVVLPFLIYVLG